MKQFLAISLIVSVVISILWFQEYHRRNLEINHERKRKIKEEADEICNFHLNMIITDSNTYPFIEAIIRKIHKNQPEYAEEIDLYKPIKRIGIIDPDMATIGFEFPGNEVLEYDLNDIKKIPDNKTFVEHIKVLAKGFINNNRSDLVNIKTILESGTRKRKVEDLNLILILLDTADKFPKFPFYDRTITEEHFRVSYFKFDTDDRVCGVYIRTASGQEIFIDKNRADNFSLINLALIIR